MNIILDKIDHYDDFKQLNIQSLKILCDEIRSFLIDNVSKTGGHLASNLGVVELTVAIHKVFDFNSDKIVFDVGHQSYVHKILTGRKDKFETLRTFGGISGFPKRNESEYDFFNTGHSSTSVSAALGMARARDLTGEKYNVLALFGDGALTGGEIYEAINDAGHIKTPLILILNDNTMSISKNVGAVSKHLRNLRINRIYFNSKRHISKIIDKIPLIGKQLRSFIEFFKRNLRRFILPTTMFEDLGFKYIGPVDGHNLESLIHCLEYAKSEKKPVILHVKTLKGKGYIPAEKHPELFHGVGKFDPLSGEIANQQKNYSAQFGQSLIRLARSNEKIVAITCAMPEGTGLLEFSKKYKNRFFDVGIAEQHGVTFAAGLAASNFIPIIPLYSSFLQRAYDQALHDVCLQNLHVVFPIDRAGIVGADGETHQGIYDLSYLSTMPNMSVLSPSSFNQFDDMLDYAVNVHNGPIAIRYPRGGTETSYEYKKFEYCKGLLRKQGTDVTIIVSGRMVKKAEDVEMLLNQNGINVEILELPTIYPLCSADIIKSVMKTKSAVVIEDNIASGGLGEHIAEMLLEKGVDCKFKSFAYPLQPIEHGTVDELDEKYGMSAENISTLILNKIVNNKKEQ